MKFRLIAAFAAIALTGCATSGGVQLTPSQQIDIAKTGLTMAKSALDTTCAQPTAPHFCSDPRSTAQISAVYNAAQDALDGVKIALAAKDGDPGALQAAIDKLIKAAADYAAIVDAFKSGRPPA